MKPSRLLGRAAAGAACCPRPRSAPPGLSRQAHHADRAPSPPVPAPTRSGASSATNSRPSGQQVIVENKPGANATIAASLVARPPGGATIFVTTNFHSAAPWLMKSVPYDPVKDFTPIARQPALHPGRQPQTALENGRRPGHRCAPAPGRITYASGGTGIVAGATLARRAHIDILHVPIRARRDLTDVVGGQVVCSPTWLPACPSCSPASCGRWRCPPRSAAPSSPTCPPWPNPACRIST